MSLLFTVKLRGKVTEKTPPFFKEICLINLIFFIVPSVSREMWYVFPSDAKYGHEVLVSLHGYSQERNFPCDFMSK